MALSAEQLNEVDQAVLDLLSEGRVTPGLARTLLAKRERADVSRQYINQRLGRLAEHGHVQNIEDSGVYECVNDPRASTDVHTAAKPVLKRLSQELDEPITIGETVYEDGDRHQITATEDEGVNDDA